MTGTVTSAYANCSTITGGSSTRTPILKSNYNLVIQSNKLNGSHFLPILLVMTIKKPVIDSSLSSIAGKGSVDISKTLRVHFVHVPNLSCNPLSVIKLAPKSPIVWLNSFLLFSISGYNIK